MAFAFLFVMFPSNHMTASAAKVEKSEESDLKISAKSALLLDYNSGTVIFSKNEQNLPLSRWCSRHLIRE